MDSPYNCLVFLEVDAFWKEDLLLRDVMGSLLI